ncbi:MULTISPECIES: DUF6344 domain-containing protein [Streptomyces]|uniref:DUF6344 domain-containing protein n=1 Tax=Streptomyces doudnae TaxID=3075536 RepID=A0ABD5ERD2_9ACTN|nr:MULTISPECIES: DUF6344 domain-containing protein [unclassified Streptomyces]MDT0436905.1 DUF6344 domain-containing protein [Streptomyces sp. DSM 41981]MYQ63064.1 hypothetical protein [Streptomyces sp. SID4950]SCD50044.1 hypothetical protein GA0115242_106613 [Streptomyces sp. SolWspMP-5a-2]
MAQNQVMKLWTAIVTAFLALCTTLGLITTTAAAAVPPTEQPRNSAPRTTTVPAPPPWSSWSTAKSLPPTMKQRIRAEAHGNSPGCRQRPLAETAAAEPDIQEQSPPDCAPAPLQR